MTRARQACGTRLIGVLLVIVLAITPSLAAQGLPNRLSDAEFWGLVSGLSESGGTFLSENFTSNETGLQLVIPELQRTLGTGGVYLGVGPEQNFTYIAALQPRMAFIVDIRRQAMLQHLLYKSLFEIADSRADFLSLMFSRPRPTGLDTNSTVVDLMQAFGTANSDSAMYYRTLAAIKKRLTITHGFAMDSQDLEGITHVFKVMFLYGPALNYSSRETGNPASKYLSGATITGSRIVISTPLPGCSLLLARSAAASEEARPIQVYIGGRAERVTTEAAQCIAAGDSAQPMSQLSGFFVQPGGAAVSIGGSANISLPLLTIPPSCGNRVCVSLNDFAGLMMLTDGTGEHRGFMANEANFRTVRDLHQRNLLVPIVGDFAGATALRAVGQYIRDHGATVSAFYLSNVEQYLFRDPATWRRFYANVATLPIDRASTFIRSAPANMLGSIAELLAAVADGRVTTYANVIALSHQ